jgi:hypothetical protein
LDAIDLLVRQHHDLEALFKRIKAAEDPARYHMFLEVADILAKHITIEEKCFYPAVAAQRTEDILRESLEEHLSLKRVLSDLLAMPAADPQFEAKLHVLLEQAEHHHKEEEEHLFPKTRKMFQASDLEKLGAEMRDMFDDLGRTDARRMIAAQTESAASLPEIQ